MEIKVNSQASDFSASDQNGKSHKLSDYKGKWILLYFYPKDFTPGCTTEACEMRDNFQELQKHLVVLGVSKDSVESHKKFTEEYKLPFTLLSDSNGDVTKLYSADGLFFNKRVSFLINPDGKIVKIYEKVIPTEHTKEVLRDIALLKSQ